MASLHSVAKLTLIFTSVAEKLATSQAIQGPSYHLSLIMTPFRGGVFTQIRISQPCSVAINLSLRHLCAAVVVYALVG